MLATVLACHRQGVAATRAVTLPEEEALVMEMLQSEHMRAVNAESVMLDLLIALDGTHNVYFIMCDWQCEMK